MSLARLMLAVSGLLAGALGAWPAATACFAAVAASAMLDLRRNAPRVRVVDPRVLHARLVARAAADPDGFARLHGLHDVDELILQLEAAISERRGDGLPVAPDALRSSRSTPSPRSAAQG